MILLFLEGKTIDQISDDMFFRRFDRAIERLPSYIGLYERWCRWIPREQILVCFYDDLVHDPTEYLARICDFIGVSHQFDHQMKEAMTKRVFEGPRVTLPIRFQKYLIEKTLPCVQEMVDAGGYPHAHRWLKDYQETLLRIGRDTA
jgi:hypothetical protein